MKWNIIQCLISFHTYSFILVPSLGLELDLMLVSSSLSLSLSLSFIQSPLCSWSAYGQPRHKNRDDHSQEISFLFQAPLELWERNLAAHTQTISKYFWQNKLKECVQKAVVVLLEQLRPPNIGMSVSFLWARGRRQVKESGVYLNGLRYLARGVTSVMTRHSLSRFLSQTPWHRNR